MRSKYSKYPHWTLPIIVLGLLVGLAGCSAPSEGEINVPSEIPPTQTSKPENTASPTEAHESAPSEIITIDFYHDIRFETPEQRSAIATLISQFNQEHEGEIVVHQSITHPRDIGYFAGRAENADCFLAEISSMKAADSGVILPLTNFMAAEASEFQQDFDTRLLNEAQYQNDLYTLPVYSQPAIMVYNADLLAELGLEPPMPDWTFDDFIELITAVANASEAEKNYGFLPYAQLVNTTELFYAGRGVQWRSNSNNIPVVTLNTPEMADTIAWMNELTESGILLDVSEKYTQIIQDLRFGRMGFWTAGAGKQDWTEDYPSSKLGFNIGIVPLPNTETPNGPFAYTNDSGFYISNQTEHPEACWELAKTISSGPIIGVPARTSIANSPGWEKYVGKENAQIYRTAYANIVTLAESNLYNNVFWYPISDWRWQAVQNITDGSNPDQELNLAQQYAEAYLECMSPYDILSLSNDEVLQNVESCKAQVEDLIVASNLQPGE